MLRLKDFSASKLMKGKKEASSCEKEGESPSVSYLKSPYFNQAESSFNRKKEKAMRKSLADSSNQINFYESGLF